MSFPVLKLSAARDHREIQSFAEATRFVERLDLSKQNLPHWQMARQGLLNAAISNGAGDLAWREFRDA
jgi:hypothetical protein